MEDLLTVSSVVMRYLILIEIMAVRKVGKNSDILVVKMVDTETEMMV
jgi:hypothetical protein